MTLLPNTHTSPETAYLVNDYPYGGLRCKIRYWLEYSKNKGVRLGSQTTNPRIKDAEVWNKLSIIFLLGCCYLNWIGYNIIFNKEYTFIAFTAQKSEFVANYWTEFLIETEKVMIDK